MPHQHNYSKVRKIDVNPLQHEISADIFNKAFFGDEALIVLIYPSVSDPSGEDCTSSRFKVGVGIIRPQVLAVTKVATHGYFLREKRLKHKPILVVSVYYV